jgi:hypothetical protein
MNRPPCDVPALTGRYADLVVYLNEHSPSYGDWPGAIRELGPIVAELDARLPGWELAAAGRIRELLAEMSVIGMDQR